MKLQVNKVGWSHSDLMTHGYQLVKNGVIYINFAKKRALLQTDKTVANYL